MKSVDSPTFLTLQVSNAESLQYGSAIRHRFDRRGGSIGTRDCDWPLLDRHGGVATLHCRVEWTDGAYNIVDMSARTFVNDGVDALGYMVAARISEGDFIYVGPYRLAAYLHDAEELASDAGGDPLYGAIDDLDRLLGLDVMGDTGGDLDSLSLERLLGIGPASAPSQAAGEVLDPLLAMDLARVRTSKAS